MLIKIKGQDVDVPDAMIFEELQKMIKSGEYHKVEKGKYEKEERGLLAKSNYMPGLKSFAAGRAIRGWPLKQWFRWDRYTNGDFSRDPKLRERLANDNPEVKITS